MSHRALFLREELGRTRENLELVLERQSEFVVSTDVPLQFIKEERRLRGRIDDLEVQLDLLRADSRRPYRGLEPFEFEQAEFYFGRTAMAAALFERVRACPLVTVVGPSGGGKSSLVRAGLGGLLQESGCWRFAAVKPERAPLHALARGLVPWLEPALSSVDQLLEANKLAEALDDGKLALPELFTRAHERSPDASFLLLIGWRWFWR